MSGFFVVVLELPEGPFGVVTFVNQMRKYFRGFPSY